VGQNVIQQAYSKRTVFLRYRVFVYDMNFIEDTQWQLASARGRRSALHHALRRQSVPVPRRYSLERFVSSRADTTKIRLRISKVRWGRSHSREHWTAV